jgi:LysM repeat protein
MKFVYRVEVLVTLMILAIVFSTDAYSQVVVEKSKDKVIISGVPYYIHQVKKGQTAYSISKAYAISVEDLVKENPSAVYGVNEGQSLRIPVKPASVEVAGATNQANKQQKDENKFIYHSLQRGETVYSLSRSYGVSENEIIQSNPGIDINKLSIGTEIAIPRREFMSDRLKFDDQESH